MFHEFEQDFTAPVCLGPTARLNLYNFYTSVSLHQVYPGNILGQCLFVNLSPQPQPSLSQTGNQNTSLCLFHDIITLKHTHTPLNAPPLISPPHSVADDRGLQVKTSCNEVFQFQGYSKTWTIVEYAHIVPLCVFPAYAKL